MLISDKSHTAILLFIRSSAIEASVKPLSYNKHDALRIADILNQRIIHQAKKTGIPTFIVDESIQKGLDFGTRLQSAFQYVFEKGFEQVIAIGNDCLHITSQQLILAQTELQQSQMVLGPAIDGGLYLLGLTKASYLKINFSALPWQTTSLHASITLIAQDSGLSIKVLQCAADIDSPAMLYKVLKTVKRLDCFIKKIQALCFYRIEVFTRVASFTGILFFLNYGLRAPPF